MPIDAKVLVIDDDADVLTSMHLLLKRHISSVETEKRSVNIANRINTEQYDLIFLDMNFKKGLNDGNEGLFWLSEIAKVQERASVVAMTAYGDVDIAVEAMKRGASDFLLKPWDNKRILSLCEKLAKPKNKKACTAKPQDAPAIIGQSESLKDLLATVEKIAQTDANVLILGENGTGKDLIASHLHKHSLRKNKDLIKVDLGALNDNLFESELFGHVKGAYTDAHADKAGRFEIAHGSSLFLDEIGNLGPALQAKLLTVLQNRRFSRLGSSDEIAVDIRLISATNMPLYKMVEEGSFRQDLLYRLNTVELTIPALRDRKGDIPILAQHFLESFAAKYNRDIEGFEASAIKKLEQHLWPGNVRELQHSIERAVILADSSIIGPNDLNLVASQQKKQEPSFTLNLLEMEKKLIQQAVEENQGNISKAAKELGITRNALYRRLEKHGL